MGDLADLEEVAEQTYVRANGRTGFGWALPPHLERARAARPPRISQVPRLDDEKSTVQTMDGQGGPERTIVSEPVTSYTELIAGIQSRIAFLGIRQIDFDKLAGFAAGLSGKVFGAAQTKRLGPEKLFDALRAAGLRLRLEPDPMQLEKMRKQIAENCQSRQANQSRTNNQNHTRPAEHLIDRVLNYLANQKGGLARLNAAVRQARSNIVRRGNATRRQMRECGTSDNILSISKTPALPSPAETPCSAEANAA